MAERNPVDTWHEITIRGPAAAVGSFVAGFLGARGEPDGAVLFDRDIGLSDHSLGERLRDLVGLGIHTRVLAPEILARALAAALAQDGKAAGLVMAEQHRIVEASFRFEAVTFNRESAGRIRGALFVALPGGVRLEDRSEQEEVQPESQGVDLYAPTHPYAYRASARVIGTVPGVLEMQRRAHTLEFVTSGDLDLTGTALPD